MSSKNNFDVLEERQTFVLKNTELMETVMADFRFWIEKKPALVCLNQGFKIVKILDQLWHEQNPSWNAYHKIGRDFADRGVSVMLRQLWHLILVCRLA